MNEYKKEFDDDDNTVFDNGDGVEDDDNHVNVLVR